MQTSFLTPSQDGYGIKVRDLPLRERPVGRLQASGAGALSTTELLACLLQTSDALAQAQQLTVEFQGLAGLLNATNVELMQVPGIGSGQAARLKAALELGRRLALEVPEELQIVRSPADVAQVLMADIGHQEQEHFVVLLLNTRNGLIRRDTVYIGTVNSSKIRVAEIFRQAIRCNAAAIIVAHNHPSGDPTPSSEDVQITRNIRQAGALVDIELLDHLIIGHQRFVSLRERMLGFE